MTLTAPGIPTGGALAPETGDKAPLAPGLLKSSIQQLVLCVVINLLRCPAVPPLSSRGHQILKLIGCAQFELLVFYPHLSVNVKVFELSVHVSPVLCH